jgi:hypothetical protein
MPDIMPLRTAIWFIEVPQLNEEITNVNFIACPNDGAGSNLPEFYWR